MSNITLFCIVIILGLGGYYSLMVLITVLMGGAFWYRFFEEIETLLVWIAPFVLIGSVFQFLYFKKRKDEAQNKSR